jgi:predicted ribosome quality control (RQC) complex YloA/Tae2 family protein
MKREIFEYKSKVYNIEIGKNKHDNFDIIESACITDIWFHVEGMSSCHVILKTYEKMNDIPRQVIKRCAYLCKINSKAKTQSKCVISYTTINNVTKTEIIGQVHVKNCKTVSV